MRKEYDRCNVWKRWAQVLQRGKRIETYFEKKGYNRIAVYGMGDLGVFLVENLFKTEIELVYGIDRIRGLCKYDILMKTPMEITDDVDAIVITPVTSFQQIYETINKYIKTDVDVIGIDEVLAALLTEEDDEMER